MTTPRSENAETLLAALDQIGEIVLVTDKTGCITYANHGFVRITGYTADEAIGKRPNMLSSGRTPVSIYRELWRTVLDGRVWEGLLINRRKNGELFDCRLVVAPVIRDGEIVRLVSVQEDLTREMEAQRSLERQAEFLEQEVAERTRDLEQHARALVQAEKLATIGELSASIAHEVLNPVMGISGALQILHNRLDPSDPNRPVIDRVRAEVQRLDETVRGLLSMVRPKVSVTRERVDLVDIIHSATDLVRSKARDLGVHITCAIEGPYWVDANPTQIRQIFLNLLLNAMHALDGSGGQVDIRCDRRGDEVWVRVIDDGPGIPDELLPRLFEAFMTTRRGGTGLGLSISRRIAKRHDGDLVGANNEEAGATFTFVIPAAVEP